MRRHSEGPVVPRKNKNTQPMVPKSYPLKNGRCEPCYSSPLQTSSNDRRLPPPPPPEHVGGSSHHVGHIYCNIPNSSSSASQYAESSLPETEEEFPPPPSPVSSSYSELRRAAQYQQDYGYGPSSQSSSMYESIYEPINPRPPPSDISSRSNYSLYSSNMPSQEGEVDALTDLLAQNRICSSSSESDLFGECSKCGERILGEGSGCTAMDKVYHISCFTCDHCAVQLEGKPFYIIEGHAYCEQGYLDTLEKCSVCVKPILDRILRATGRPYHPVCFKCVVCGQSLDGIPFTVDATNQIHCIEDFHKKFAPRCCVCKEPIMPNSDKGETVRVVALDRSFHIECYRCEDCKLVLSSEAEGRGCYPLDDHILCKSCNAKRVQKLTSTMVTEL